VDFQLDEEFRLLNETVNKFVENELMPLEAVVLAREAHGGSHELTDEELAPLHDKCR